MRTNFFVLFAAFFLTAVLPSSASACSCNNFEATPAEFVEQADVILFGTAISAALDEENPAGFKANGTATFRAERAVKGAKSGDIVEVRFFASGTSCDLSVSVGVQTFYFFYKTDERLHYTLCGQPYVFGDELVEYLDIFEEKYGVEFNEIRRFAN